MVGSRQARQNPSAEGDDVPDAGAVGGRDREKVGIWLPRGLRQRLRIHAAVLDREISEVIAQSITEYLDRHDAQRAAEGLPPIPLR